MPWQRLQKMKRASLLANSSIDTSPKYVTFLSSICAWVCRID
jgi:hypothetical protein